MEDTQKILKTPIYIFGLVAIITIITIAYFFVQKPFTKSKAGENITLSFQPAPISISTIGQEVEVSVKASPSLAIRGYEFNVAIDGAKVEVTSVTYLVGSRSNTLGGGGSIGANMVRVRGEILSADPATYNPGDTLVKIKFKSKSQLASTAEISGVKFYKVNTDLSITEVTGGGSPLQINGGVANTPTPTTVPGATNTPTPTIVPGATNTPTPTPTRTPTPTPTGPTQTPTPTPTGTISNVQLNLKLKFQGILDRQPPGELNLMRVKVTARNSSLQVDTAGYGDFVANNGGLWTGQVSLNIPAGGGYRILIKGPKHIQKKICEAQPQETAPGTYPGESGCLTDAITLQNGVNTFGFAGIYQLVGDLPNQDGFVNSYDTSLVYNNLGKTDNEALRLADVNLDGAVNTQDYSLIIAALSIRSDEQ